MTDEPRQFVAFISYSHRDTQWAAWIQKAVERYSLPTPLVKETGLPKRLGKVFRDREELATGQNLGDHLLGALDNSDNLIVICSPNAVNSQWVGQEIEYFKSIGRGDRVFCLLVDGGAEALPAPLLTDIDGNPLEPLAADPRETGDGKRLAKLKLISGILGVNLDQLTRREQARQNQLRAIYTGIAGLIVVMAAAAFISFREQQLAKQQEAFERQTAMENAANMVEFAERIRTQIDMESQALVNNQLIEYLERSGTDNLDLNTTRYLAQAYQQLGIAKLQQGTDERAIVDKVIADQAVANFARSSDLFNVALGISPDDPGVRFDVGIADFWAGNIRLRRGEFELAKSPLENYAQAMMALYEADSTNPDYVIERVYAQQALLTLAIKTASSYNDELASQVATAVSIASEATLQFPISSDAWDAQLSIANLAATGLEQDCRYKDTTLLAYRQLASQSALKALELEPRSRFFKQGAAEMYAALAHTYDSLGRIKKAREAYLNAYRLRVELADTDPTNEFAASQVIKSKLDILRLRTHAGDGSPMSFTEGEALHDFDTARGRAAATEANLEAFWLLYQSENAIKRGELPRAKRLIPQLRALLETATIEDSNITVSPMAVYMAELLIKSMEVPSASTDSLVSKFELPVALDCRSRINRWLGFSIVGDSNQAKTELDAMKQQNFSPSYMAFYESLIEQLN